jgi:hypothetical protein
MKPKLEYGSNGSAVAEAQAKLNALLPQAQPPLVVDGKYGTKTVKRVMEFQKSRGLVADGIVGAKTWAALDGAPSPKPGQKPPANQPKNPQLTGKRVPFGTKTHCSYGSAISSLRFPLHERQVANVSDYFAYGNVGPFGKCHSLHNPEVQVMTQAKQGVFTPMSCRPVFPSMWSPGQPIEKVGNPPCAALDMNSVLVCAWGGLVTILPKK